MTPGELHAEIGKLLAEDRHLEGPQATPRCWAACKVRLRRDVLLVGADSSFSAQSLERDVSAIAAAARIVLRLAVAPRVVIRVIE